MTERRGEIEVFPTPTALAQAAAERWVTAAATAIAERGRFVIALAGGSTPRALYALLAEEAYARRVDWPRVHVFWGDERCVPPEAPESNFRMAREALLDRVAVPPAQVHRVRGEEDPALAAAGYAREIRSVLSSPDAGFDLVLLGLGTDGHTASLFPGLTAMHETERWVVAEYVAAVSMWRVTLTPPAINAAAAVAFLVAGAEKAAVLHRVLDGRSDPDLLPAQAVMPRDGRLTWLIDEAAAAELERVKGGRP